MSRPVLPALSTERVTVDVRGEDAGPGAVADLTADHWVAAERLRLTLGALRTHRPRRADTVTGDWLTQPGTTVTGWRRDERDTVSYREEEVHQRRNIVLCFFINTTQLLTSEESVLTMYSYTTYTSDLIL